MFRRWIYPSYVRISGASRRSTRRVSERGQLIQMGIIITAALGVDTELTLIYQLFCFLIVLYFGARLTTLWHRPHLSLHRQMPRYVTAGEPFSYRVRATNLGPRAEEDLRLSDNPVINVPDYEEFAAAREPGEEDRNAYDRFIGFHRFVWLQRVRTGILTNPSQIPTVPVRGSVEVKMEATPLRRGRINLSSMTVAQPDPLGITFGFEHFPDAAQIIALPKRYPLPNGYAPPGGRHYQPGGISSAWSVGESHEFVSLRDYREGDSLRKIHWPSSAKRDKPVVREHQDEFYVRQALVLDTCSADGDLLEDAVSVAASFAATVDTGDSLLDLIFLAEEPFLCTAGRGTAHAEQLLEILSSVTRSRNSFDQLSDAVLHHTQVLSGVMLIVIDYDEARQELVRRLSALGLPLDVLVITREEDIPLPPDGERIRTRALRHGSIGEDLGQL